MSLFRHMQLYKGLLMVALLSCAIHPPVARSEEPRVEPKLLDKRPADEKESAAAKQALAVYPQDEGILLELDECIEIAIQNNLNLQINRLTDRAADYNVRAAWAQYFPTFNESLLHSNAEGVGRHGAAAHGTTTLSSGITQNTPWGTKLDFVYDESRVNFGQASRSATTSVSQPLWKGAGTDANLAQIRTARLNRLITRANLDLSTQKLIFTVNSDYNGVVQFLQVREVDRQAVRSAKTFLDLTQARERAGQETRLDVYQAELQMRQRELALITNERQLGNAFDALKQVMDIDLEEKIRVRAEDLSFGDKPEKKTIEVLETDEPKGVVYLVKRDADNNKQIGESKILFQAQHFSDPRVLSEALDNRIELLNGRRTLAVQHLQTMLAKNGLGYQVDLVGSHSHSFVDSSLRGAGSTSDANNWTAGIKASIPWGKIADKASYEIALLDLQKTEIELKQVRTIVHAQVRDVLRTLREAEKTILIEALAVEQAKRTVEATRISFERGLKSSFEVVRVEDDLLSAKNIFISRRLEYVVDIANLDLTVGKPTGRVDLGGQTLGGLIDSHMPESLNSKMQPRRAPDADPSCEDFPLNKSRAYRCDPKPEPDTRLILTPGKKPPCNCELLDDAPWPAGNR